jgi:uncharacterized protein YndB with AHSA1/START domain
MERQGPPAATTHAAARVVHAGAERVFAALVDADALLRWLPPQGMTGQFEHFDARTGGSYRLVLSYEPGAAGAGKTTAGSDVVEVRFVELVPGVRVVQAVEFVAEDETFAGTMTMTWSLSPAEGGTRVEIRAENVPPGIGAEEHTVGMASSLANLAAFLEDGRGEATME